MRVAGARNETNVAPRIHAIPTKTPPDAVPEAGKRVNYSPCPATSVAPVPAPHKAIQPAPDEHRVVTTAQVRQSSVSLLRRLRSCRKSSPCHWRCRSCKRRHESRRSRHRPHSETLDHVIENIEHAHLSVRPPARCARPTPRSSTHDDGERDTRQAHRTHCTSWRVRTRRRATPRWHGCRRRQYLASCN